MRYYHAIALFGLFLIIFMPGLFVSDSYGNKSDPASECEARCEAMDDESRYQCMKTCVNAKRRNEPLRKDDVKERMAACEDACSGYTGVEKIKCIRICLDKKKKSVVIKKNALHTNNDNPCEVRCGVLSGVSRDTCLLRCKRESRFKKRD